MDKAPILTDKQLILDKVREWREAHNNKLISFDKNRDITLECQRDSDHEYYSKEIDSLNTQLDKFANDIDAEREKVKVLESSLADCKKQMEDMVIGERENIINEICNHNRR